MCNCVHGVLLGATQASCLCVIKKITGSGVILLLFTAISYYYLAKYIKVYYKIFSSSELLNS